MIMSSGNKEFLWSQPAKSPWTDFDSYWLWIVRLLEHSADKPVAFPRVTVIISGQDTRGDGLPHLFAVPGIPRYDKIGFVGKRQIANALPVLIVSVFPFKHCLRSATTRPSEPGGSVIMTRRTLSSTCMPTLGRGRIDTRLLPLMCPEISFVPSGDAAIAAWRTHSATWTARHTGTAIFRTRSSCMRSKTANDGLGFGFLQYETYFTFTRLHRPPLQNFDSTDLKKPDTGFHNWTVSPLMCKSAGT